MSDLIPECRREPLRRARIGESVHADPAVRLRQARRPLDGVVAVGRLGEERTSGRTRSTARSCSSAMNSQLALVRAIAGQPRLRHHGSGSPREQRRRPGRLTNWRSRWESRFRLRPAHGARLHLHLREHAMARDCQPSGGPSNSSPNTPGRPESGPAESGHLAVDQVTLGLGTPRNVSWWGRRPSRPEGRGSTDSARSLRTSTQDRLRAAVRWAVESC